MRPARWKQIVRQFPELRSYIHMLVYHERKGAQQRGLHEVIEASVATDAHRREVQTMQRTIAEELEEKGRRKGRQEGRQDGRQEGRQEGALQARQQTLLRQLRRRLTEVPDSVVAAVSGCADVAQLDAWLDKFATARSIAEVGINGAS